jgi:uncharacterized protein
LVRASDSGGNSASGVAGGGRIAGPTWAWLIDLSGWFLVLVSVTGLGLLVYLKKFRISALIAMLVGTVIMLALMRMAS